MRFFAPICCFLIVVICLSNTGYAQNARIINTWKSEALYYSLSDKNIKYLSFYEDGFFQEISKDCVTDSILYYESGKYEYKNNFWKMISVHTTRVNDYNRLKAGVESFETQLLNFGRIKFSKDSTSMKLVLVRRGIAYRVSLARKEKFNPRYYGIRTYINFLFRRKFRIKYNLTEKEVRMDPVHPK